MSAEAFDRLATKGYFQITTAGTTAEQLRDILSAGSSEWEQDLAIAISEFDYQGFDPQYTMSLLLERCKGDLAKERQLTNDIMNMSALVALRGTNFDKILAHSTEKLALLMDRWQSTYSLVTKRPTRTGYKKKDINLARVANLCPYFACATAKMSQHNAVPAEELIDVPKAMWCTQFAGCIPRDHQATQWLKSKHQVYLVALDKVIHSKDKKYTDPADIIKYQEAAINSQFNNDQKRIKWLNMLEVLVPDTSSIASGSSGVSPNLEQPRPASQKVKGSN